ncbi:hypothetical protein BpHYR1_040057 [Brachionus plicatilis]|uniref:Uncharacterized protein n=1 Tax=Brachionus plicatilis TaxID=10195 RepID=A0A3M7RWR2_BRAPC|nr:hypothetical protein BpHYR1_040057 [Brachionus plicatilis]
MPKELDLTFRFKELNFSIVISSLLAQPGQFKNKKQIKENNSMDFIDTFAALNKNNLLLVVKHRPHCVRP